MYIVFVTISLFCRDVHCGRIQCQGGNDRPLLGTNAEILTTKVRLNYSDFVCRGTYFHLGDDVSDPAMVAQGTACGLGKVGISRDIDQASQLLSLLDYLYIISTKVYNMSRICTLIQLSKCIKNIRND